MKYKLNNSQYIMNCEDNSLFTPFFNKHIIYPIASQIPQKITPNSITLSGVFIFCIGMFFMWLGIKVHQYFLILSGGFIFCFGIADGLDGVHARNTDQCSVLGEFLDHFIDLVTYNIIFAGAFIVFHISDYLFLLGMTSSTVNFYSLHAQRYKTGQMNIGPISTYESLSLIAILLLIDAIFRGNILLEIWVKFDPQRLSLVTFIVVAIAFVLFKDTIKLFQTFREWADLIMICLNAAIIYMIAANLSYGTILMSGLIICMGGIFSSDYILMQHFKVKLFNRYIISALFIVSGFLFISLELFQNLSFTFSIILLISSMFILGKNFYMGSVT